MSAWHLNISEQFCSILTHAFEAVTWSALRRVVELEADSIAFFEEDDRIVAAFPLIGQQEVPTVGVKQKSEVAITILW